MTVAAIREVNSFYTGLSGVRGGGLLEKPYSLTEARVIFELAQGEPVDVAYLRTALDVDAGYLSRILGRFEAEKVVVKARSTVDARRQVIRLTTKGRGLATLLDDRSNAQVDALLAPHG